MTEVPGEERQANSIQLSKKKKKNEFYQYSTEIQILEWVINGIDYVHWWPEFPKNKLDQVNFISFSW